MTTPSNKHTANFLYNMIATYTTIILKICIFFKGVVPIYGLIDKTFYN